MPVIMKGPENGKFLDNKKAYTFRLFDKDKDFNKVKYYMEDLGHYVHYNDGDRIPVPQRIESGIYDNAFIIEENGIINSIIIYYIDDSNILNFSIMFFNKKYLRVSLKFAFFYFTEFMENYDFIVFETKLDFIIKFYSKCGAIKIRDNKFFILKYRDTLSIKPITFLLGI